MHAAFDPLQCRLDGCRFLHESPIHGEVMPLLAKATRWLSFLLCDEAMFENIGRDVMPTCDLGVTLHALNDPP